MSWALAADASSDAASTETSATETRNIGITSILISDGSFAYIDAATGQTLRIADLDARLGLPADGPATVEGTAEVNGTLLTLAATLAAPRALTIGATSPLDLALDWRGGSARFDGRAELTPAFSGDLQVDATDLGPLLAILGAAMPDLPQGYGRDRLALAGQVTLTEAGTAHLRDARLTLDDTQLTLALDLTPGADRPMIRGTVTGARLVLPADGPAGGQGSGTAPATQTGWSRTPIDVSGLFAADAEIALVVERIEGAGLTLGPVGLRATLDRGRLVLDIDRVGTYGGVLAGQFVVNGRGGLSVRSDVILAGVDLNPLLTDLADYDRLEGSGSISLQLLGVGNDMATLMASLEGEGDLALGAGRRSGASIWPA